MHFEITKADDLWQLSLKELKRSNADPKHPFRQMVFATSSDYPSLRTVVKRSIDTQLNIWFYSDSRAPKIAEILINPNASILFYHPKKQLQIRMTGKTILHLEGEFYEKHFQIACQRPSDYNKINPPGSKLENAETGDKINFALIQFVPFAFDTLLLHPEGHKRAVFRYQDMEWKGDLVTP